MCVCVYRLPFDRLTYPDTSILCFIGAHSPIHQQLMVAKSLKKKIELKLSNKFQWISYKYVLCFYNVETYLNYEFDIVFDNNLCYCLFFFLGFQGSIMNHEINEMRPFVLEHGLGFSFERKKSKIKY